jgi:hypothetical protein
VRDLRAGGALGQEQRVQGGKEEYGYLKRLGTMKLHCVRAMAPPGQQHDGAPAEAYQKPITTSHVGDRVALLGYDRVAPGLIREDGVHGVFRQDRNQGQHSQRECLRYIHLE